MTQDRNDLENAELAPGAATSTGRAPGPTPGDLAVGRHRRDPHRLFERVGFTMLPSPTVRLCLGAGGAVPADLVSVVVFVAWRLTFSGFLLN